MPRILVVVLVPENINDWLAQSEQQLAMKHCGYWLSLRGMEPNSNSTTVTVHLPRIQCFSVNALRDMMTRIGEGSAP